MKLLKEHTVFIFILGICIVLRLWPLFDYQFTYDELSGLHRTQFNSFSDLIEKGVKIDAHPALVQVIIYYLSQCFGYVNWVIKLPFLLFGFAAVIYAYFFCLRNFSKISAQISAAVFSFSLVFVFYAPIARMYISGVFFSSALLYYFFEIFFQNNNQTKNYVLLGVFAWLCALNQHINALFAFTVFVSGFFFLNKTTAKPFLITCFAVVLAYLPVIKITLYQLGLAGIGTEQGGWLEKPSLEAAFYFLKMVLGTGKSYWVFILLILVSAGVNRKILLDKKQLLLLSLFIINYLVVFLYSIYRAPIFQNSVMLFSGVGIVFLIASLIHFHSYYLKMASVLIISSLLLYKTYVKKDYPHQAVKTVFEYQFERTDYYKKLLGHKNVYPIFFDADSIMRRIYFKKYNTDFAFKMSGDSIIANMSKVYFSDSAYSKITGGAGTISSLRLFSEFVATLPADYVALSSPSPIYCAIVSQHFPYLIENTQTQGINYKLYSKKRDSTLPPVEDDKIIASSTPQNKGSYSYPKISGKLIEGQEFIIKVDSATEFPFEASSKYSDFVGSEGQMVVAMARLKSAQNIQKVELCGSVKDIEQGTLHSYCSKEVMDFKPNADGSVTIFSDMYIGRNHVKIKDSSKITFYLWNKGQENFELLDFEIKLADYWHQKWHFWD